MTPTAGGPGGTMAPRPVRPAVAPLPAPTLGPEWLPLAGKLLMALAVAEVLQPFVLGFVLKYDARVPGALSRAAFFAVLGFLMAQGDEEGTRKGTRVLSTMAIVVVALLAAPLAFFRFFYLWPQLLAVLAIAFGARVLAVNAYEDARNALIGFGVLTAGVAGSVASWYLLAGGVDVVTMKEIVLRRSPLPAIVNGEAGLTMRPPSSWAPLQDGNTLLDRENAIVSLASTRTSSLAAIVRAYSTTETLDSFLDGVAKPIEKHSDFQTIGRADATIGGVPARRLDVQWTRDGAVMQASLTGWQDSDALYALHVTAPKMLARRLAADVDELSRSLAITQPWTAFLKDKGQAIATDCPLLSDAAILTLARAVPRDSPSEVFCREGYRLAAIGLPRLDPDVQKRFAQRIRVFFNALPTSSRPAFSAYTDRIRANPKATSAKEDKVITDAMRRAVLALPPKVQEDLRADFAAAIAVGSFSETLDKS